MGGGGKEGEVQKKIRAKENKMKKILARQLTLKNIHAIALKKSYKEFDNDKKFLRLENSPSPHNFSNGPSLIERKVYENQSKIT